MSEETTQIADDAEQFPPAFELGECPDGIDADTWRDARIEQYDDQLFKWSEQYPMSAVMYVAGWSQSGEGQGLEAAKEKWPECPGFEYIDGIPDEMDHHEESGWEYRTAIVEYLGNLGSAEAVPEVDGWEAVAKWNLPPETRMYDEDSETVGVLYIGEYAYLLCYRRPEEGTLRRLFWDNHVEWDPRLGEIDEGDGLFVCGLIADAMNTEIEEVKTERDTAQARVQELEQWIKELINKFHGIYISGDDVLARLVEVVDENDKRDRNTRASLFKKYSNAVCAFEAEAVLRMKHEQRIKELEAQLVEQNANKA